MTKYDGFLFGFPTRYGRAPACVSAFFDQTGGLWAQGALVGKFAGIFVRLGSSRCPPTEADRTFADLFSFPARRTGDYRSHHHPLPRPPRNRFRFVGLTYSVARPADLVSNLPVPIGFAASQLSDNTEIVGGSAYGAAAIASGDGSRAVTEKELAVATYQGQSFAKFVGTFVAGKSA